MAYTNSLKKHIEFMAHTATFSYENIIELDAVVERFGMSLRQAIMHIFSASRPNWNLFVAVDTSFYGNCVNFAFREELQEEAMNMISALPLFLEAHLGHSDVWKWFTRRARNEAVDYEWHLEKGLVPKYDAFMITQLEDWEQLDEIDDVNSCPPPLSSSLLPLTSNPLEQTPTAMKTQFKHLPSSPQHKKTMERLEPLIPMMTMMIPLKTKQ